MASQSRFTSTTPLHWVPPSSGPNDELAAAGGDGQENIPIDPALLGVPPAFGAPAEGGVQGVTASGTTASGVTVGQKRTRHTDYAQWARTQAGLARLNRDMADDVVSFTQLDDDQREITSFIKMCQIEQKLNDLAKSKSDGAVTWAIHSTLSAFIQEEAYETILDPTLSNYINAPKETTCERLRNETQYNLVYLHMDNMKATTIKTRVEKKLTDGRGKVKEILENSVSTAEGKRIDIFTMCLSINQLSSRRKRTLQSPTVAMLGRFAFIRYCYVEAVKVGKEQFDFWPYVDFSLKQLREGNNNDPVKISQVLHSFLLDDQTLYGKINAEEVHINTAADVLA
ncbi:unnamed protein product [Peniophora sp. CBMAI 1063]|nr:unnamed protein product [Peniophora sp. CBMAI 1063]